MAVGAAGVCAAAGGRGVDVPEWGGGGVGCVVAGSGGGVFELERAIAVVRRRKALLNRAD